jgi:virginiamycin B lyase
MMTRSIASGGMLLVSALLFQGCAVAAERPTVEIHEWSVPWETTRPRDPAVDGEGRVWFVGQRGDYLARLDPLLGNFHRVELAEGTLPHNLVVDSAGMVWFAGNGNATIGRLDPDSGEIVSYAMPDPAARDPHTLVLDGRGSLWFTVQRGSFVGRLDTSTGAIRLIEVPGEGARPYGITVDSSGRPWFVHAGTNLIGTVDPEMMELRQYPLPEGVRSRRLAIGADGMVWFADSGRGKLGRFDPQREEVRDWDVPGGPSASPYAMALDRSGRIWFVETGHQPNRLIGFDPRSQEFVSTTAIPSGAGSVRHMIFDHTRSAIWFGTDANTIGRATLR